MGIRFVLFDLSLQKKKKSPCTVNEVMLDSVSSDQSLHCLPKSQKMPLDRSNGQIHLKVMGCQVCFICCKFTKVPVLFANSVNP